MNDEGTTITLKNENGEYTVKHFDAEMNLYDVMEYLVKPVLHAAGYSHTTIEQYFDQIDEDTLYILNVDRGKV